MTVEAEGSQTDVPNYVTESGQVEELKSRPKVGSPQDEMEKGIYDRQLDSIYLVDPTQIDGINDKQAFLKEYYRDASLQSEINAGLRLIFLCHVAGYDLIRPLLPNIIEQIYGSYQLDKKKLPNYPFIQESQAHEALVQQRADTLFHIFHAAI